MKGHEEYERILASYRDASVEERTRADAHVQVCAQCAARRAAFDRVDAALGGMSQPSLPLSLARPLPTVLANVERRGKAAPQSPGALGSVFRGLGAGLLAPAGVILFLVIALSAVLWSVNSVRAPVTMTPTLTTTFTPTTFVSQSAAQTATQVAAQTATRQAVGFQPLPTTLAPDFAVEPTPAPIPAPVAQPHGPVLLAGYSTRAKITN